MLKSEVEIYLEQFKDRLIKQAKSNLTKSKKNSSKNLYNSIKGNVKVMPNSFSIDIEMEDYGIFQDKGVSGVKKKYNTPYSYTTKMPPPSKLDKWIVRKGIAPRNEKGEFINRKSLKFLIARGIFTNGIKPSLFLTKPFENEFKKLPNEIIEKFGLDIEDLFMHSLNIQK
jgi:hypothetical protein